MKKNNKRKNNKRTARTRHFRKFALTCILFLLAFWLYLCISLRIAPRSTVITDGDCTLYYIVNVDGMKGLGHSILLLVDEQGRGTVFSFNGMQKSLTENLLGQAGVGKMSVGKMDADETARFLQTGDLKLEGDQLNDNYDWAVYRPITSEAYDAVLESAQPYIRTGKTFETLYLQWAQAGNDATKKNLARDLEEMGKDHSLPLYQIYTNNCDHAARSLAAAADRDLQDSPAHTWHITPGGNLKAFSHMAPSWGVAELGENSVPEKLLTFFIIF